MHSADDMVIPDIDTGGFRRVSNYRYFNCKKNRSVLYQSENCILSGHFRYFWDSSEGTFILLEGLDKKVSIGELHEAETGLAEDEGRMRGRLFGKNEIIVPLDSILMLMIKEILTPFYVFQVFSIVFWYFDEYWKYSSAILFTSVVSLSSALYQTRRNQQNLRDKIVSSEKVTRIRPEGRAEVISTDLVPGDVILVPGHGCQLLCDAVLLAGQAIMDESMLTGESVPVTKTSLPKHPPATLYHPKDHEKHTLKCGTIVIQARQEYRDQEVKAIVIRTGYNTTKGDLVRSILYPPPVDFQFEKDSHKFIGALAGIAIIGMIYTMVKMWIADETVHDIIFEVFDLITIVVPPALPAAMTLGIVLANQRLIPANIFCISPRTINVAGAVDCTCFDKTGTITEDGMDMWGVVASYRGMSRLLGEAVSGLGWHPAEREVTQMAGDGLLVLGMATCHELNIIEGVMRGDPLDEKMFSSTGWSMELDGEESAQLDQLSVPYVRSPRTASNSVIQAAQQKVFQFSSDVQRMSVITRVMEEKEDGFSEPVTMVFCKGSPEMIQRLCRPETIPDDFDHVLESYASRGFRIIALASKVINPSNAKVLKLKKMTREQTEVDLEFLGLIIMENRLKPASVGVIRELKNADIRTIMVTGDNILTAVSVARDCGIVRPGEDIIRCKAEWVNNVPKVTYVKLEDRAPTDTKAKDVKLNMESRPYHIAIDGSSFTVICEDEQTRAAELPYIAARGAVFARMRPEMKQHLVEILQDMNYRVIMCGDGANDCGALKAADAGISLSEAEASVASPFTSKTPDISCVPILIRESRCALVTAFGLFKYMAAYSLTQFVSVIILYEMFSNLSDMQFLWIDLFLITTLAAVFGYSKAHAGPLAPTAPMSSLISIVPLFSLISQIAIAIVFQVAALLYSRRQSWFVEFDYENPCYHGTKAEENFYRQKLNTTYGGCDPEEDPVASYENFAVFNMSQFQYIILIIAFAKGAPYRETFYKNFPLILDVVLLTAFCVYLTIWPDWWTSCALEFESFAPPQNDMTFRWVLMGMVGANLVISILFETLVADGLVRKCDKSSVKKHETINQALDTEFRDSWPPLTSEDAGNLSSGLTAASSESLGQGEDGRVVIMKADKAKTQHLFDSLLSTPGSSVSSPGHSAAAICLNPPAPAPGSGRAGGRQEIVMASPSKSFTTAQASPSSSMGTAKFESCDTLGEQEERQVER